MRLIGRSGLRLVAMVVLCVPMFAQQKEIVWSEQEKPLIEKIRTLRKLPDDVRTQTTKDLALKIRELPSVPNKLRLAVSLARLSTEGDFGKQTLQEVATTLAGALREQPVAPEKGEIPEPYLELASLVRYEHVQASLDDSQYSAAMKKLETDDEHRQSADFQLTDLEGKNWKLHDLHGKVVLVNFWATWCPPCRKEMPDLEKLYERFKNDGLIILAISDEDSGKVKPFIAQQGVTYPILLDPGRKVNEQFQVMGIPKTFVYDREGKLVAQSVDMRTQKQFLEMLSQAGLK